jgi:hypothetical protein
MALPIVTDISQNCINLLPTAQAAGLCSCNATHPLISETAAHDSDFLRLRSEPNRLMSLMKELLSEYKQFD